MSRLVAVDPGSRTTGWAAFDHGKLAYFGVIDNAGNLTPDDTSAEYIRSVYRQVTRLHPNTIAVESVTAPKGFKGGVRAPINPEGMAGLGAAWPIFGHGPWHRWFAWRPVDTYTHGWKWLRVVERRRWQADVPGSPSGWDYRTIARKAAS